MTKLLSTTEGALPRNNLNRLLLTKHWDSLSINKNPESGLPWWCSG